MKHYRPDIDGLRTIAVGAVLLYHLGLSSIAPAGFVGVDVFFVISGFLITSKIVRDLELGRFSFADFYLARIRRIFPALFVTVILTILAGAILQSPGAFQDLNRSAIAAVGSVSNIFFWLSSGYFDTDSSAKPLLHTWSLGVEEQFYLFWPALLAAVFWWRRRAVLYVALAASVLSLVAAEIFLRIDPSAVFYLFPFRICELGLGALLVWVVDRWRVPNILAEFGLLLGLAIILAAIFLITKETPFPGFIAMIPCAGAALAIMFGRARFSSIVLTNRFAVWVGLISYSLYLVHWPIIVLSKYTLMRDLTATETAITFVVCIAAAGLMYALVEQPFRKRTEDKFNVAAKPLLLATGALAAIAVVPAVSGAASGWQWRLGERGAVVASISDPRWFHTTYFGGNGCAPTRCETNPAAKHKAYLLGDSHARALFSGLKSTFPEINFVIYAPDMCPFYTIDRGRHDDRFAEDCLKVRPKAFAEIAKSDGPVFTTHHWLAHLLSSHQRDDGTGNTLAFDNDEDFAEFVVDELRALKELIGDQPLVVIGGVPRYNAPQSPLDCISRPFKSGYCDTSLRKDRYIAAQDNINKEISDIINLPFLDPYNVLCDDNVCRNFDGGGRPIYSDKAHLSIWGSRYLIGLLAYKISGYLPNELRTARKAGDLGG